MVVLLGAVAFVTDIGMATVWTREAQAAADAGALAGDIDIPGTNGVPQDNTQAVIDATTITNQNLANAGITGATVVAYSPPQFSQSHNGDSSSVEVKITATSPPFFLRVLGVSPLQIKAHAVASSQGSVGSPPILVGDKNAPDSLDVGENPNESLGGQYQPSGGLPLSAPTGGPNCDPSTFADCTLVSVNGPAYTNSLAPDGEEVHANYVLSTTGNNASGGTSQLCGSGETCGTFDPPPAPGTGTQFPDPLAYLTPPTNVITDGLWTESLPHTAGPFCKPGPPPGLVPSCIVTNASKPVTAFPGVYNTLAVEGPGSLTLSPGTYVITGSLQLTGTQNGSNSGASTGKLTGNGVTLYFACPSSTAPYWTDCPSGGGVSGFKGTPDTCTVNCCPNDCSGAATTGGCPNKCSPGGFFNIQTGNGASSLFNLSAPTNGPYQGVLIFMDRNNYVQRPGASNENQETFNMEMSGSPKDVVSGTIYGDHSNFWMVAPRTNTKSKGAPAFGPNSCIIVNSLGIYGPGNQTVSCSPTYNAVPSRVPFGGASLTE